MGAVADYLDTSILVALFTPEPFSEHADAIVREGSGGLMVSGLAVAEFSSAMARRVRMREFSFEQAAIVLSTFDEWVAQSAQRVEIAAADVALATAYIRRFDLSLRTPDALHIAIATRLDARLVTFDRMMAAAARALGTAVAQPWRHVGGAATPRYCGDLNRRTSAAMPLRLQNARYS